MLRSREPRIFDIEYNERFKKPQIKATAKINEKLSRKLKAKRKIVVQNKDLQNANSMLPQPIMNINVDMSTAINIQSSGLPVPAQEMPTFMFGEAGTPLMPSNEAYEALTSKAVWPAELNSDQQFSSSGFQTGRKTRQH